MMYGSVGSEPYCGRSGLYLQALLMACQLPSLRAFATCADVYADQHGTPALHRRLQHVDPVAAASIIHTIVSVLSGP
jgi:tRNA A37 N6-isopentenylltransferase MiaA